MDQLLLLSLSKVPGLGTKTLLSLMKAFPNLKFRDLFKNEIFSQINDYVRSSKVTEYLSDEEYMGELLKKCEKELSTYLQQGVHLISFLDERYPEILKAIDNPPAILYCRGNLKALSVEKKIAVIGTRNATPKGLNAAGKIASTFAKMGYVIVSGLALGIDTAGHLGALEAKGLTIAVLAGGVDDKSIYPAKNKKLASDILESNGLLVSEYPPGQKPAKSSFVQRDRIQSGLSLGICPVQTDIIGGTQHTIKFAENQGRLIFCPIPAEEGDIPAYRGIYKLMNDSKTFILKNKDSYRELDDLMENLITVKTKKPIKPEVNHNRMEKDRELTLFDFNNETNNQEQLRNFRSLIDELCRFAKDLELDQEEVIKMLETQWENWR